MSLFSLPLHPSLVHFPLALLFLGAIASLVYEWKPYTWLKSWGFVSLLIGWILSVPAMITGLIDKSGIEIGTSADQVADQHTTAILLSWVLYGLALYWQYRWQKDESWPRRRWQWALLLIAASAILLIAGHLGGRLVYEMHVGVQPQ